MALEQELATFDRELPQLLRTMRGQFVLIHGEEMTGPYRSEDDAYVAGCEKYGVEPLLVMLVEENERPIPLLQDVPPYHGHMNEIPPDVMADLQAVADAAASGRAVDP